MRKFYSYIVAAILMAGFIGVQSNLAVGQTYTQLTSIATIDENAQYVLGTYESSAYYFHYDGTSSWGKIAAPTSETPYYYTLSKGNNNTTFTATVTIGNSTYYLTVPSSNAWTLSTTSTSIYINEGTICASSSSTGRYLQKNGTSGLRSYNANNNYPNAYFYKVAQTITFNGNGGIYNNANTYTQSVNRNYQTALQANQFTREGYTFTGWNTNSAGNGTAYAAGANVTLTSDLTLYAQWESNTEPNISANNVNLLVSATSGSIAYTVNNQVTGGVLTAAITAGNTGSWLSLGEVTSTTVPLNCSANIGAERTATVTLTYTYNTNQTVTKNVIVTQAAPTFTVTYDKNGGSGTNYTTSAYTYGTEITVLGVDDDNINFTAPSGKAFDHWSTASDGGTAYDPNDTFNITGNVTLYAQWRTLHTYSLVTSTDQIVPGKHYIIANSKESGTTRYAMGSQNGDYRSQVQVTVNVEKINNEDHIYIYETANVSEIIICGKDADDFYTIYDANDSKYLQAPSTTSGGSNNLNESTTIDNAKGRWAISFGDTDKNAIFEANHTGKYIIRYNSTNTRFSCYGATNSMADVFLYLKDNDNDGTIYSATTLSKNESYDNLTIVKNTNVNGSITVPNNMTLTVTGTLTNQGTAANLVIEDGGQLITSNAVNATVKKHINGYSEATGVGNTDGWYFIASPVSYDPDGTNLLDNEHDLFFYDEENVMWRNYEDAGSGYGGFTMEPKQGYLYANDEDVDLSFAGLMPASNTANVTVDLSYSDGATIPGFNLVGNPFTCNVSSFKLKNKTTSDVSNLTTYYVVEDGTEIVSSTDPIKPGQGFMVEAGESNQQLVFNYVAAKGETATKPAFVSIEAGNDAFMDRAFVQIGQGNTLRKMKLNENVAHVWLMQDGKDYAAASITEACGEMPVSFKAAKDGEYTLTVNAEGVEMNYLHLIDNLTGADTDLLATPSYTFNARTTDYASRFRLVFGANDENGASTGSATFAYVSNGQVVVNGTGTLQVVDMLGRIVASQEVTTANCQLSTANYKTGVYVLRLVNNGDVKTQKMVIE